MAYHQQEASKDEGEVPLTGIVQTGADGHAPLVARRFVQSMYGSLPGSEAALTLRELRRASGASCFALRS